MAQHMQRLFLTENQYEETRERLKRYLVGVDPKARASLSLVSFFYCNYLPIYGMVGILSSICGSTKKERKSVYDGFCGQ